MAEAQIVLKGVGKTFVRGLQRTTALAGVDIEIARGAFVAVVGPSGCGKSTLLRLVSGLVMPSEGSVRVAGEPVVGPRADTGIVFQKATLVDWRDILGNVLLQLEMRGIDGPEARERARTLLTAVGLGGFENRYPHELSGGMQQRAAIARGLVHQPGMLLMDEPFGALDALTREQMRLDLEALWLRERMTVFFITHSIDEAVLLADRVIVMSQRPGTVDHVFDVDLPRPRGLAARNDPRFAALTDAITRIFLSRGVLDEQRLAL
ncbi:ABC transporter ATP-binding protein [Prosthecomicrobium hirschii]|jgi:NitT/TauT family transport system ATP-binding protein|uniref:ABC transporter ATP-binding protein n=1 Tax=Prosthecodimorpha hirschii TaxID=665126 RepID=A0A0P6VH05_9HYPH|nr:ABC transporter ATP-binding protein [Prosthecomicrobium hirschii]KPL51312.1 ABC transporter ATP-binding protein [Prosthecomicrobium hirschii]TPQ48029.1 ABC transporter ATP-binding protein [Prosthecomicrobium hirschii]